MARTPPGNASTRLIMLLVVSGAAAAGFLSSAIMLWMGLRFMPARYALAWLAGYSVFLILMNRWLGHHHRSTLVEDLADAGTSIDLPGGLFQGGSRAAGRTADGVFRGGRSGGGGASASFDAMGAAPPNPVLPVLGSRAEKGSSKGFSLDLDDADGALPLLAVVAIVVGLIACVSVIWSAPQMLGELLADGAAAGAAYQGLRHSGSDWTLGVIRRTWLPATVILVTFVLLGFAGRHFKPGADSIGDFFR
jgi:hypothetical protein